MRIELEFLTTSRPYNPNLRRGQRLLHRCLNSRWATETGLREQLQTERSARTDGFWVIGGPQPVPRDGLELDPELLGGVRRELDAASASR